MHDDTEKSLVDKTIAAVKHIAEIATHAAEHALDPEPLKPGETVVMLPPANDGLLGAPEMPTYVVVPARTKSRKKASATKVAAKKAAKKSTSKSKKAAPKKNAKKTSKTSAKKAVKKAGKKKSKKLGR
jgi:hypothetical protein